MSRLLTYLLPVIVIAGGYFGFKEIKPRWKVWRVEQIVKEVCRHTAERVEKGLAEDGAGQTFQEELIYRLKDRANVHLDESQYTTSIYQEECTAELELEPDKPITFRAAFLP